MDDLISQGHKYTDDAQAPTSSSRHAHSDHTRSAVAPVSVVVPCFRCVDTIGDAVASVAAQTLPPAEVLLVDDGSGDGTLQRLHDIARSYRPGWVRVLALERNAGPSAARNLGWAHAVQQYLAFLDADDTWHPRKLKVQMEVLAADPQIALLTHQMIVQSRSELPPAQTIPLKVRVLPRHLLHLRSPFSTPSIIIRRDLPFRFDENRRRSEDFLLWAQILLSGYRCATINQVLASLHKAPFGAGGLSADLPAMFKAGNDARRVLHKQGLLSSGQLHLVNAIGVLRYVRRLVLTFGRSRVNGWRQRRCIRDGKFLT